MTTSPGLTDVQHLLLTAAAHRDDGSFLPLVEDIPGGPAAHRKELQSLIRGGLAAEVTSACPETLWRKTGRRPLGLVITDLGRAAIAVQTQGPEVVKSDAGEAAGDHDPSPSQAPSNMAPPPPQVRQTKSGLVLEMLGRESGATLDELTTATAWLPHSTRAALTGLRKKGHIIERRKRDHATCYHLASRA